MAKIPGHHLHEGSKQKASAFIEFTVEPTSTVSAEAHLARWPQVGYPTAKRYRGKFTVVNTEMCESLACTANIS